MGRRPRRDVGAVERARARHGALNFATGVRSVVEAFRTLIRDRSLWPYALVPAVVLAALEAACIALALSIARPWALAHLPGATSAAGRFGVELVAALATLTVVALGSWLAVTLAPALSAPALERIVERIESEEQLPPRPKLGFFNEVACGFRAMVGAAALGSILLLVLSGAELMFPAIAIVTTPLKLIVSSLALAWGLFDYPLTLRGRGFRTRLALVRAHFGCFLGFGLTLSVAFWLPCCGVVLLPVGVAAAARLNSKIEISQRALALEQ